MKMKLHLLNDFILLSVRLFRHFDTSMLHQLYFVELLRNLHKDDVEVVKCNGN
jgi:hypothetical protein